MRVYELIPNETELRSTIQPKQHKTKQHEHLSEREWREVMGENRDRYKRVNGRVKRK